MTNINETTFKIVDTQYSLGSEWPLFHNPKYTYHLHITPGFIINIVEGQEPNWFQRWMQRICFGFRWEKID